MIELSHLKGKVKKRTNVNDYEKIRTQAFEKIS